MTGLATIENDPDIANSNKGCKYEIEMIPIFSFKQAQC